MKDPWRGTGKESGWAESVKINGLAKGYYIQDEDCLLICSYVAPDIPIKSTVWMMGQTV